MKARYGILQTIENFHPITKESDPLFLLQIQNSLLIALMEQGILDSIQYQSAYQKLKGR